VAHQIKPEDKIKQAAQYEALKQPLLRLLDGPSSTTACQEKTTAFSGRVGQPLARANSLADRRNLIADSPNIAEPF
jgi:hypothetical protein